MPVLSVQGLSKDYRYTPLFSNLTFSIDWTDRVGLIGANGSGKTTLLKLIAGKEIPDSGTIHIPPGKIVGYLPQNPDLDPERTVLDALFAANNATLQLIHDYEAACTELALSGNSNDVLAKRVTELSQQIDAAGAWDLETNIKIILDRLGITDFEQKVGSLSGGQRKRVALANALITQPDLLILDEPTNHLDAETIDWLEQYLRRYSGALLLVTHDRYFLDRVTNRIIELDRGTLASYAGNYAYYIEKKEEEEERKEVESEKRAALLKQELAWLKRGAKARTTKQKARIDRAEELMAHPKEAKPEELELIIQTTKLGTKVIEMEKVSKSYDGKALLKNFTYAITRGERVGIVGRNGSGKTTLLEIVTGRTKPDEGKLEVGPTVVYGYYDQESRGLDEEERLIDYVKELGENLRTGDGQIISAGKMLERFLFPPSMHFSPIKKLSGGERRRLYLLRILMAAPNVLLLDEPTNDLDIKTLTVLEDFLANFTGTVIVVSHDRYFLDKTVDHIFRFEGDGRIREYPGNYSAFLEIRDRELAENQPKVEKQKPAQTKEASDKPRKLSYKEKKELESLEAEIAQLEAKKSTAEAQLSENASDFSKITELSADLKKIEERLEVAISRWAELAEFA